jgi:hypothetical protein
MLLGALLMLFRRMTTLLKVLGALLVLFIRITTLLKAPISKTGVVSLLKVNFRWGIISYNMPG